MNKRQRCLRKMEREGWRVLRRRNHIVLQHQDTGNRLVVSLSPGDWRAAQNDAARRRRLAQ